MTGGMNAFERDGISTTDLFNTGEDNSDEVKNKSFIELVLPISDAIFHSPRIFSYYSKALRYAASIGARNLKICGFELGPKTLLGQ